jgi:hypothetical protein
MSLSACTCFDAGTAGPATQEWHAGIILKAPGIFPFASNFAQARYRDTEPQYRSARASGSGSGTLSKFLFRASAHGSQPAPQQQVQVKVAVEERTPTQHLARAHTR